MTSRVRGPQLSDVRGPAAPLTLLALCFLVVATLLLITSYMNFFWDEWDFVSYDRPWNLTLLLLPHNEHWSTIPILIWKVLFVLVGIRSHIPYEAVLLVVHAIAALLLFTLIRHRSGDLPAFAAGLTLLVLGSGGTNIVWAFQIGFVGSVAFGLLAMVLLDGDPPFPSRMLFASAALTASVMSSAVGLAFLAAVSVELATDRRRRRFLIATIAPAIAFAEWFLAYGAGLLGTPGEPCPTCEATGFAVDIHSGQVGFAYFMSLGDFMVSGLEASAGGVFGLPELATALLPLLAFVVLLHWYRRGGLAGRQLGMAAGLITWLILISLGRAQNGPATASEPRYVYVSVVFLLPIIAQAVAALPWHGIWRPLLTAAFAICLVGNAAQLWGRASVDPLPSLNRDRSLSQQELMRTEIAELQVVELFRGAPDMTLDRSIDDRIMPQLNAGPYLSAVAELGSPVTEPTNEILDRLPPETVNRVMVNLFGPSLRATPASSLVSDGSSCESVDSTFGSMIAVTARSGSTLLLESSGGGDAYLFLGFGITPMPQPLQHLRLNPGGANLIHVPNTGRTVDWQLWIRTGAVGTATVCGQKSVEVNPTINFTYSAPADAGRLASGWSSVSDPRASKARAAKSIPGHYGGYQSDLFGTPIMLLPVPYDVWYRVKVDDAAVGMPEMTFGLWDIDAGSWVISTTYDPKSVGTNYTAVEVGAGIIPAPGHRVQFIATFQGTLTTGWYVDNATILASHYTNGGRYLATAHIGSRDPGWAVVSDAAASDGYAVMAGTVASTYQSCLFGTPLVPRASTYDVWYRIRSSKGSNHRELSVGLWDDDAARWATTATLGPNQVGLSYSWIRVATGVVFVRGHHIQFLATYKGQLTSDWYIDQGAIVPSGLPVQSGGGE